ncbi:MAG: cytochrome P450 [Gammaproteobacteria bacterium]|nr:cytochrome P450 [Gammaproteobacteria bacterium]
MGPSQEFGVGLLGFPSAQLPKNGLFAWKVLVERADADACPFRDSVRAGRGVPGLNQNPSGRIEDRRNSRHGATLLRVLAQCVGGVGAWRTCIVHRVGESEYENRAIARILAARRISAALAVKSVRPVPWLRASASTKVTGEVQNTRRIALHHVPAIEVASDRLSRTPNDDLAHLPGPRGHWYFGNVRELLPDPTPFLTEMRAAHGDCFTVGMLRNRRVIVLAGAAANRLVLLDADSNFSSRLGWEATLDFLSGFVLLRDFEDHAFHRDLLRPFFKADALRRDLVSMNRVIRREVNGLAGTSDGYRLAKRLALDIALAVFAGFSLPRRDETMHSDTERMLDGVLARRSMLPGSRYRRALRARNRLRGAFLAEVPRRRDADGVDLFGRLSRFTDSSGRRLGDQDGVHHVFGMIFAAHETTASAMSLMMHSLARHPEWQARLRAEVVARCPDETPTLEELSDMPVAEAVFRETLRLYSPIQFLPRRNVRPFDWCGHRIPANSHVLLPPQLCHRDASRFEDPDSFRPDRFFAGSARQHVDPFAWVPFGRGSHMCMGTHFALLEVKAFFVHLLRLFDLKQTMTDAPAVQHLPLLRPKGRLPMTFVRRHS